MSQCKNKFTQSMYDELVTYINELDTVEGNLIEILHKAQSIFGYLPNEIQRFVAKQLDIPVSKVTGVVSFYSYFTTVPKGDYPISICLGTACYVRGANNILDIFKQELGIDMGQTTADGKYSLDALRCVGACGLAPVVLVGEEVFGRITTKEQVLDILKSTNKEEQA